MSDPMTPEECGRRWVALPCWRWMPGMLALLGTPEGIAAGLSCVRVASERDAHGPCGAPAGAIPDVTDPATIGCLLALAAPLIDSVHTVDGTEGYAIYVGPRGTRATRILPLAEAVLVALEAVAPSR